MDPERLKPILEAALLASPQPLTPARLAELFDEIDRPTPDAIAQTLHALAQDCNGRGIELVEVGSGFRYQVRGDVFPHISGLWTERQTRYSRALLETISLIAYRQPITRGEIEQIRGVAVATSILRTLEEREWVRVVGHRDVPGRPALYGTTRAFLDYFQLKSLDELPPLSALRDLDTLEPELALELGAPAALVEAVAAGADGTAPSADAAPQPGVESNDDAAAAADPQQADELAADADADADSASHVDAVDADSDADADADADVVDDTSDHSDIAYADADADEDPDPAAMSPDAGDTNEPEDQDDGRESGRDANDAATTAARD